MVTTNNLSNFNNLNLVLNIHFFMRLTVQSDTRPFLLSRIPSLALLLCLMPGCTLLSQQDLKQQRQSLENAKQRLLEDMADLRKKEIKLAETQQQLEQQQSELDSETTRLNTLAQTLEERSKLAPATADTQPAANGRIVVGEAEPVYLEPSGLTLDARIDTGATTSSLNALDLTEFERDGKAYVRFYIVNPETQEKVKIERKVYRHVRIKQNADTYDRRPVIKMRVVMGEIDQRIKFTLVDRSDFEYQVLIGRNFLRDYAVVDVGHKALTSPQLKD